MMADDLESDTGVGFKRRVSEIVELRSLEEPHLAPRSPLQQSPGMGSAPKEGTLTVRHGSDCDLESFNCLQKKAKCSSEQENQETDQCELVLFSEGSKEKQGIAEDKLDCKYEDVTMKLNDDKFDAVGFPSSVLHFPPLDENDTGFSEIDESGNVNKSSRSRLSVEEVEMDSAVEGCNNHLAESCTPFGEDVSDSSLENKNEQFSSVNRLESFSDSNSHIVNFTGESIVVIEEKHNDGRSARDEVHKMAYNESQRPRGGDVKCALKIQVIDDTAVIGSVSASRVAKHMEKNVNKNNKHQETFANEKKSRRRGKGLKKCSGTSGDVKVFTQIVDSQRGHEMKADVEEKKKWGYSRKEMEALRFVNVEEQKKKWIEIYCGFGPAVTKEYDGLVDSNHQKHIRVNFDPRPLLRKKDAAPPILSDECYDETQSMNCLGPACDSVVVQEEFIEDDDFDDSDEEEYSSIQRPAFLVTGKPDFDSGPPQDGLEYLRRVRWEAEHIPKVKVAKVDRSKLNKEQTVYMPSIPDIVRCPDHLLPLKEWEDSFLANFSELRLAVSRYESCTNICAEPQLLSTAVHEQECSNQIPDTILVREKFENLTVGEEVDSTKCFEAVNQEADDSLSSRPSPNSLVGECGPTLSTIIGGMDFVARVSMLKKRISSVESMSCLSRNDCMWLFALCATVDTPLNADTCASLRCLLRKCASLRSQKTEMDDEVVMLNILSTICGKYFGQSDN